jgi:hypothetical protein
MFFACGSPKLRPSGLVHTSRLLLADADVCDSVLFRRLFFPEFLSDISGPDIGYFLSELDSEYRKTPMYSEYGVYMTLQRAAIKPV